MAGPWRREVVAAVAAALIGGGFAAGFVAAQVARPHAAPVGQSPDGGFAWPFFGKPRAADAPRALPRKPDGFAVWTTRLDSKRADPQACIRFSRDLDPRRSYGDFVSMAPALDHPAAVTVNGDELCVAGVGYEPRKITLLHGLPSASGEVLAEDAVVEFGQGEKQAYVGFSGSGVILPREDADGLGIETVNVSKLKIELWRVPDRNLVRKDISAPEPTPEGGYDSDGGDSGVGDDGRQVWSGSLEVHGKTDERTTTVFPFGAVLKTLEPGAYVIKARDDSAVKAPKDKGGDSDSDDGKGARARRWILFTDMALQAYRGSDALDVTVRSLKTAKAMAGVRVALVGKDGKDLGVAASDASGHVRFERAMLGGEAGAAPSRVMAYGPRADFTVLNLEQAPVDLSKQDIGGRTPPGGVPQTGKAALDPTAGLDGFVYADRGVYRPGETVHIVALLRDRLAHAVKDRRGAIVIRRPSGLELTRLRFDNTPDGAAAQDLVLPRTAPRGRWRATLEMDGSDGAAGETSFQVEDFAPQRLAVTVGGDAGRPVLAGEQRQVQIDAKFLYGAVAAGLPVQADARITADPDPFPAFKDFSWGDEQTPFPEKLAQSPATTTDGAGHAIETLDASAVQNATQPLVATFNASVFEPGGRPVAEKARLKLRMKPLYLGVKTTSGAGAQPQQTFDIVAVDANGARVAAKGINYLLVAEHWDYEWFEQNGRWSWKRTNRDIPIAKGALAIEAGRAARISRALPWGDYRLILEDPATGAKTVVRQASGWGEPVDGIEAPDTARVSPVKASYRTGETVRIHIQAPFAGEAQVAVATDRLLALKTVSVPAGGGDVSLKAEASWNGGAYVLVSVVQPRDPVASPKPRRALGVAYVPLETPGRKLSVDIATPAKFDSHAQVVVPVQVKGLSMGRRAHVTLAAVDEGILRLTHQANPDPAAWYFGKRAMTLDYRDDYGRLLDPNLGAAAAVNFGADQMGGAGLSATPIKTVALWSGVVETGLDGKAKITLPAADYNGQLRLVAVAWTDDAVGSGVSDVIVREPVVAELSLPRFLAPGDHAFATVELHNVEGKVGGYLAELFGQNGVMAPFHKLYQLVLGQRVVERTEIVGAPNPSVGAVDLKVSGPGFTTTKHYPIETRQGWGPLTRATTALQQPGETFTPTPDLLAGLSPGGGLSMTVSYSPFRGFDPAPIADSLSRYPYGCSEQIVSAAYPLLYAPEVGTDPKLKRVSPAIAGAISKLLDRQALDGSFGLWRVGDGEADPWLGAYITDFLLEAKARGAVVPQDAIDRSLSAMRTISKPEGFGSIGYTTEIQPASKTDVERAKAATARLRSRATAYALYVLAKGRHGDLPRLRWFHDVGFKTEPSALARAQTGAALAAMGDGGRAHDSFVKAVDALAFREPDDIYQSPLRDLAGVIALAYEAGETGIARSLQGRLEATVKDPDALNTQEQAHLLHAASRMLQATGPMRINAVGAPSLGGSRWAVGRLADAHFTNVGGAIWRTVTVHGLPSSVPPAGAAGLTVEKRLFTLDGRPVDPAQLKQGDRVLVRLVGRLAEARSRMVVIDDALPAGFEIESTLKPEDAQGAKGEDGKATAGPFAFAGILTEPSTQEKRDDRYIAAMTLTGGKPFVLAYVARAVTPGDFFLPGAEARDMYRPTVRGRTASGRTHIAPGQ